MPEPLSVDKFQGVMRRPQADQIPNGAHVIFRDVNLYDNSIKGNRGKLKQNLVASSGLGKNGLFYYENSTGQRELILCNSTTVTNHFINPATTFFYSYSTGFSNNTGGHSLAVDGTGNSYILQASSSTIHKYSLDGSTHTTFTIPDSFRGYGIAVSDDGEMWVSTQDAGAGQYRLYRLSVAGLSEAYIATVSLRKFPVYKQGYLYIDNGADVEIYNSTTLALVTTVSGTVGDVIRDMAFSPDGNLYVVYYNTTSGTILKKIYGTTLSTVVTIGTTIDSSSTAMAVDEYERIWIIFSAETTKTVYVYDSDGTEIERFFHSDSSNNIDPFNLGTASIGCYTNSLIIHDTGTFNGVKVFVYQKW